MPNDIDIHPALWETAERLPTPNPKDEQSPPRINTDDADSQISDDSTENSPSDSDNENTAQFNIAIGVANGDTQLDVRRIGNAVAGK